MTEREPGPDQQEMSNDDCVAFLDLIVRLVDAELDEAGRAEVRRHLDSCDPCLEKYDLQRTVKALVARSCSERAPVELRQRVLLRIRTVRSSITDG